MIDELFKNRSYKLFRERNFEKAKNLVQRGLEETPEDDRAVELLGDIYLQMGREEEAVKQYQHSYEIVKDEYRALALLLKRKQIEGEHKDINRDIAQITLSLNLKPLFTKTVVNFLNGALNAEKPEEGIELLQELDADNPTVLEILGYYQFATGRQENAIETLAQSRELYEKQENKEKAEEIDRLISAEEEGLDIEKLKEIIRIEGIEERKLEPSGTLELADLLANIGSKEEAINEYFSSIYGYIVEDKNVKKAKEILEKIKELNQEDQRIPATEEYLQNPPPGEKTSEITEPMERITSAIPNLFKKEESSNLVSAIKYFTLSMLHEESLNLISYLSEKGTDIKPVFPCYLFNLFEMGEYEKIIEESSTGQEDRYVQFFSALAYEKLGDKNRALEILGTIYEQTPDFLDVEEQIQRLREEEIPEAVELEEVVEEPSVVEPEVEEPVTVETSVEKEKDASASKEPLKRQLKDRFLIIT